MSKEIQDFLDKLQDSTSFLDHPDLVELIAEAKKLSQNKNLQLLIIGTVGSGRFSIANILLNQPGFLPVTAVPKKAVRTKVSFGESVKAELRDDQQLITAVPVEQLRTLLTQPNGLDKSQMLAVTGPAALLKTTDLHIETLGEEKPEGEWRKILAAKDFALLVLKGTAVLSELEKTLIRDVLKPYFGLGRVALLVNKMDLIRTEEQGDVLEYVHSFLDDFGPQTTVISFSAAQALKELKAGTLHNHNGFQELFRLVNQNLLPPNRRLRSASLRQTVQSCMDAISKAVASQAKRIAADAADAERSRLKIDKQNEWILGRKDQAQHRVEIFMRAFVQKPLLQDISGFKMALQEQLPEELRLSKNIQKVRRHLPAYIERVWRDFLVSQEYLIRKKTIEEVERVQQQVSGDLQELTGKHPNDINLHLASFSIDVLSLQTFFMPRRGKHKVGPYATGLNILGLLALPFTPVFGLASIGSGQLMRLFNQKDMEQADQQALLDSTIQGLRELKSKRKSR